MFETLFGFKLSKKEKQASKVSHDILNEVQKDLLNSNEELKKKSEEDRIFYTTHNRKLRDVAREIARAAGQI